MATSPAPDRTSFDALNSHITTMELRQEFYEFRMNRDIRDLKKEQRDLIDNHKREVLRRQGCLVGSIKAVDDRVDYSDKTMLNLQRTMSIVKAQVRKLEAGEFKKQVAELDHAIKKTQEEHEKEIAELNNTLKDAREENAKLRRDHEKLCREYKSSKKTTLTMFEMLLSRLGDLTEEVRGGDVSEDHEMEED